MQKKQKELLRWILNIHEKHVSITSKYTNKREMLSICFLKNQEWKQTTFDSERETWEFSIDSLSLSLSSTFINTNTQIPKNHIDFNQKARQNRQ